MLSPVFPSAEASLHTLMGKPSPCRAGLSLLAAFALIFSHVPAATAAPLMTRAEYEACQARDEPAFRSAIEAVTRKGLEASLVGFDYKVVLGEEWRRGNVDDLIDRQVDLAVGQVREESSGCSCCNRWPPRARRRSLRPRLPSASTARRP